MTPIKTINAFEGARELLVVGKGDITIERSFDGVTFYPMTDESGAELTYSSATECVLINATLHSHSKTMSYRITASSPEDITACEVGY